MGSIRPHSSRRKPVEVWAIYHDTEDEHTEVLFWYKKDAERYLIEHANDVRDEDKEITGIKAALKYLNDSYDTYYIDTKVVHS